MERALSTNGSIRSKTDRQEPEFVPESTAFDSETWAIADQLVVVCWNSKSIMDQAIVFTAGRLEQRWSFCCVAGTRVHKVRISVKLSNIGKITKVGVNDGEK